RAGVPGEEIEQLREVLAEGVAAGEEPEIAVDPAGPRVVVAGREVAVAVNAIRLLSHDETRLAVNLQADGAIDHVRAHLLERAGPVNVRFLVEARLQLHEDGDLLAVLDRGAQGMGDG